MFIKRVKALMNNALSQAIKEAYAVSNITQVILETIELRHAKLSTPIRLINQRQGLQLTLETGESFFFEAVGFSFTLPAALSVKSSGEVISVTAFI